MIDTNTIEVESVATTTPTYHVPFSPSSLNQYRECPGAYYMQLGFPRETSPEADEGTMLHDCVARHDVSGLNAEQEEQVQKCFALLDEIKAKYKNVEILFEQRVTAYAEDGKTELTSGTIDVVILIKDDNGSVIGVKIIDWKFGRQKVIEVMRNLQLAPYALAVMQKYWQNECEAIVFQSRLNYKDSYTFTNQQAIIHNVSAVIERAKSEKLVLNAGEACRWCKAKSVCPAFGRVFGALTTTDDKTTMPTDPEALYTLWSKKQIVEKYIKQIEEAVKSFVTEHGSLFDLHFVEKAGNREFNDVDKLTERIGDLLTKKEFLSACKISVTQIVSMLSEKLIAQNAANGVKLTKVNAKKQIEEQLADLIVRGKPTKTLAQD